MCEWQAANQLYAILIYLSIICNFTSFMVSLKIQEHANKFSTDLSGGTKRKVSLTVFTWKYPFWKEVHTRVCFVVRVSYYFSWVTSWVTLGIPELYYWTNHQQEWTHSPNDFSGRFNTLSYKNTFVCLKAMTPADVTKDLSVTQCSVKNILYWLIWLNAKMSL